jgi:Na+-translocating ferredoxin:NAD+ oxidoreductase RnfC subunit
LAQSLARAIEKAGVVGAGGGGFPSHVKARATADTVLANGAECEPLLRADSELMLRSPGRVMRGLSLVMESVGAKRGVLALKGKNKRAVQALGDAAEKTPSIEFSLLENVYPAGDEFLLVFDVTGRVVPEGGIPIDVGVVVHNVTTLAQIADAAEGRPVTRRMVTVQGEIARPATFLVPIGTALADLVALAGGATIDDPAIIVGGPMMGRVASNPQEPSTKVVAGIIVLPKDHRVVTTRTAAESRVLALARAACCQCLACTELCPRALLGHDLAPHRTVRAIQYGTWPGELEHVTSAYLCCECGMCELFACPLEIQPRRILSDLKAELARRGIRNPHTRKDLSADDVRPYRQIPTSRLVQRLGLSEYDVPAPLDERDVRPNAVVLRLKQHVGAPAKPIVEKGRRVLEGDVVGEVDSGTLGARLHASISGVVTAVSPEEISIAAA